MPLNSGVNAHHGQVVKQTERHVVVFANGAAGFCHIFQARRVNKDDIELTVACLEVADDTGQGSAPGVEFLVGPVAPFVFARQIVITIVGAAFYDEQVGGLEALGTVDKGDSHFATISQDADVTDTRASHRVVLSQVHACLGLQLPEVDIFFVLDIRIRILYQESRIGGSAFESSERVAQNTESRVGLLNGILCDDLRQ